MSKYMALLIIAGALPFILSFWPGLKFYRKPMALVYSLGITTLLFGGWDIFAVWRRHWQFSPEYVWRFRLLSLPLEEWLFFIVIPFCCIFSWEVVKYFKGKVR